MAAASVDYSRISDPPVRADLCSTRPLLSSFPQTKYQVPQLCAAVRACLHGRNDYSEIDILEEISPPPPPHIDAEPTGGVTIPHDGIEDGEDDR